MSYSPGFLALHQFLFALLRKRNCHLSCYIRNTEVHYNYFCNIYQNHCLRQLTGLKKAGLKEQQQIQSERKIIKSGQGWWLADLGAGFVSLGASCGRADWETGARSSKSKPAGLVAGCGLWYKLWLLRLLPTWGWMFAEWGADSRWKQDVENGGKTLTTNPMFRSLHVIGINPMVKARLSTAYIVYYTVKT